MRNDKKNLIVDLSFEFALQTIDFLETLNAQNKKVIPIQLLSQGLALVQIFGKLRIPKARKTSFISLKLPPKKQTKRLIG